MKVSVVGLGIMGSAIVRKLLDAEQKVVINSRSKAKAEALIALGAEWVHTPGEAAREADVVITMVKDPQAVEEVTLGEKGILAFISEKSVHAEMSTVSPKSADAIAAHYQKAGKRFVQAPVLGSRKQIEDATLLIMAGGETSDVETCQHMWQKFSKNVAHGISFTGSGHETLLQYADRTNDIRARTVAGFRTRLWCRSIDVFGSARAIST
jgi:3-hydroxyisobutyrate dehydrogenase